MTATTTPDVPIDGSPGRARSGFRRDIQGLRAVAVLLVLGYHAGFGLLAGGYVGVDVFFVISGFLITGLIEREVTSTGRLALGRFYARRARRLLPAAGVVLAATAALTVLALPVTRWRDVAGDIVGSTVYLVNWRLAERSVDYLAAESAASPVQHFWSLAVEEQFYILWPLLILAVVRLGRRRWPVRARLTAGLLLIALPSFLWSIHLSGADPGRAYFVTTTRVWELALGALLALHAGRAASLPRRLRTIVGWAGVGAIAAAALTFDSATVFPGAAAALPTLGTAAVLLAGTGVEGGLAGPLRWSLMQRIGALSYSLYLWHWPLLVVAQSVWGRPDGTLTASAGLLVVTASAVPAWLTHRLVENPLHHARSLEPPRRALALAVACTALSLTAAAGLHVAADRQVARSEAVSAQAPGAAVLLDAEPDPARLSLPDSAEAVSPPLAQAPDDVADVYDDGCHQDQQDSEVLSCTYGQRTSGTSVALVGDSHAAHWQPALRQAAEDASWRVDTYTKSSCLYGEAMVWLDVAEGPYTSCHQWQEELTDQLLESRPDVVVVGQTGYDLAEDGRRVSGSDSPDGVAEGMAVTWQRLEDAGIDVIAVVDTPWWSGDVPECLARHEDDLEACLMPRDEGMAASRGSRLVPEAAARVPDATLLDLTDYFCSADQCYPVIGDVITFSDRHHVTATYSRTLAPVLRAAVEDEAEDM